jgi:hypothetical protein
VIAGQMKTFSPPSGWQISGAGCGWVPEHEAIMQHGLADTSGDGFFPRK